MTDELRQSAYELYTKPILTITDEELEKVIIPDLRKRRALYKQGKGTPDTPGKKKASPTTASEKKQNTLDILASLDLKL